MNSVEVLEWIDDREELTEEVLFSLLQDIKIRQLSKVKNILFFIYKNYNE